MTIEERLQRIEQMIGDGIIKIPSSTIPGRFLEIKFDGESAKTEIVHYTESRAVLATGQTTIILQTQNP